MKDYDKANIPLAKTLRKNMTPWERKLWYEFLRNYPVLFQRQKAICNLDIDRNFSGVCEYIHLAVQNSLPQSASLTAPSSEGAMDTVGVEQQINRPMKNS